MGSVSSLRCVEATDVCLSAVALVGRVSDSGALPASSHLYPTERTTMTTATPTKRTPSAELAKLQAARDKAHAKVRETRQARDEWDAETRQLQAEYTAHRHANPDDYFGGDFRPKPGSEAERQALAIRKRLTNGNPVLEDYEAALAPVRELDRLLETFKRERVRSRIEEALVDRESPDKARKAIGQLLAWLSSEQQAIEAVRAVVQDTPTLQRQRQHTLSFDSRVGEWENLLGGMLEAIEEGIATPGLTAFAEDRVRNLGR